MSDSPPPPPPPGHPPTDPPADGEATDGDLSAMDPSETQITGGLSTALPGPTEDTPAPAACPPAAPPPPVPQAPVPPAGGYGALPIAPPPTQAGWGAGGGVPPYGAAPQPPSRGGGAKPLIIALIVVFGLAALVLVGAVLLIVLADGDDNDAPSVVRTTLASVTTSTVPPDSTTTEATTASTATTDTTAPSGEEINVFELEEGDCFDVPTSGNITNVAGLDCDVPHDNEVYAIFEIAGGDDAPFPGEASISRRAQRRCTGALFTDYVGAPFAGQTQFSATSINPTRETWESEINDREVICVITSFDENPLAASARDAEA